jgi:probable rRNA maturation factor
VEGELAISTDTAHRQAGHRGHSIEAELALYAIHGVLHLLGYEDKTKAKAARMHEVEDILLESIGVGPVYARPPTAGRQTSRRERMPA